MNEYISKTTAIEELEEEIGAIDNPDARDALINMGLKIALRDIKRLPAADVQPVKHGRWEETHISLCKWIPGDEKEEGHSFYMAELKCSCCERYNAVTFALVLNKPDFCQLCGARMIKDGDTE